MPADDLARRAEVVFSTDTGQPPPLSLRGANALDSYEAAPPFDATDDAPTDAYLEQFGFWGIGYLDAQSWRHYLPRLMAYACAHPQDPRMVTEALVHSLRPPDRYPPRLGSLTDDQEQVVRELLEAIALGELVPGLQAEAQQALEEWWLPNPRARPTPADVAARRAMPVTWRPVAGPGYRLLVPDTFTGSGPRDIPQESRHVQTWGGALCYDAPAVVAVNITARDGRALADILHERVATLLCDAGTASPLNVPGASEALRLDGWHAGDSPAARQRVALVLSAAGGDLVLLTVRSWPRDDVDREREVIVHSLVLQR